MDSSDLGTWEGHLKVKFIGRWWKISLLNLAKFIGLETELYSGGTGKGEL